MADKRQDIVLSNSLIKAQYRPTSVYQMRLMLAAIMQIKAKESLDYKTKYTVTASQLAELTGTKEGDNYRHLVKAAKDLLNTQITIEYAPNGDKNQPDSMDMNIVSSCAYFKNEGLVKLRFTDEITPYISSLTTRFTKYEAKQVMFMQSVYGIRLYEILLSCVEKRRTLNTEYEISVDDFRRTFELEKKYKLHAALRKNAINPALKDINTHSDMHVTFKQRKAGRVVSHFVFTITKQAKEPKAKKAPKRAGTGNTNVNLNYAEKKAVSDKAAADAKRERMEAKQRAEEEKRQAEEREQKLSDECAKQIRTAYLNALSEENKLELFFELKSQQDASIQKSIKNLDSHWLAAEVNVRIPRFKTQLKACIAAKKAG